MDTLLLRLGSRLCISWVAAVCVVVIVGYKGYDLYLTRQIAIDLRTNNNMLSSIERRLSAVEAKQDEILKLLRPQEAAQLSAEEETTLTGAYQYLALVFERRALDLKLQGPPGF